MFGELGATIRAWRLRAPGPAGSGCAGASSRLNANPLDDGRSFKWLVARGCIAVVCASPSDSSCGEFEIELLVLGAPASRRDRERCACLNIMTMMTGAGRAQHRDRWRTRCEDPGEPGKTIALGTRAAFKERREVEPMLMWRAPPASR